MVDGSGIDSRWRRDFSRPSIPTLGPTQPMGTGFTPWVRRPERGADYNSIPPIVEATRCTNVSNLFYFGMTLYSFRTVFPSSSGVRDCTYDNRHLLNGYCCLLLYVESRTPDDGRKDRPKYVHCHLSN